MPPKKKLRRWPVHLRRTHRPWSRRAVGEAPAEERASPNQFLAPRRPNSLRAPPRRRGTSSVLVPMVPYARWTQIGPVGPEALRASKRTSVLERAWRGYLDRALLLLTWLGVRAHPDPRAIRCLFPPPQQKLSHELSCSWTTLQRRTSSTAGGPPFRASSVSPTATRHGSPARRSRGRPPRREPMEPRLAEVRPPRTLRTSGSGRRLAGPSTTTTPLRRRTRELVATNAKSFTSGRKKTLEPASSAKEKRGVNQTSALSHLATCTLRGSQAPCRIR